MANFGKVFGFLGKSVGNVGRGVAKTAAVAGGGFLGGLMSGATGGKLGGDAQNNNSSSGGVTRSVIGPGGSFFGISTSINTKVNGPISSKDNCCAQSIALLSSIDETLKRSLYISQRLAAQNSEIMAEGGNQKIAGLGGSAETLRDTSEKVGFDIGKTILSMIALFIAGNAGKIFDPNRNEDGGIDLLGGATGALASGVLGGKKKIANAIIGGVTGANPGDGLYKAKSTEGMVGGTIGSVGGGILSGMAGGAAAGAAAGLLFGPGAPIASTIFAFVGTIAGGIIGSGLFEDAGEAIGDTVAGKFNEEVNARKIGKDAASEFNKNVRGKRDPAIPPMTVGDGVRLKPLTYYGGSPSDGGIEGYMQTVATREGNVQGGKTHDTTRSSAAGRYGFLNQFNSKTPDKLGTWDENLIKVMPETASYTPKQRFDMMKNPAIEDKVMKRFTEDNISSLEKGLLRSPTWEEVDMAHVLGAAGAVKFIKAYEKNPSTPARSILPQYVLDANPELTAGSLQDFKNRRTKTSGMMAAGNTKVSAVSPVALPIEPLITPKTVTGEIDRAALIEKYKVPMAAPNTIVMNQPAPAAKNNNMPAVPYPVDGPRLPLVTSQFIPKNLYGMGM